MRLHDVSEWLNQFVCMTLGRFLGLLFILGLAFFLRFYVPALKFSRPAFSFNGLGRVGDLGLSAVKTIGSRLGADVSGFPSGLLSRTGLGRVLGLYSSGQGAGFKKVAENLPAGIKNTLPQIADFLSSESKEETYLKAPKSFNLPEVRVEDFDQQVTVGLSGFEVKDTRKSGGWTLSVKAKDLIGERGVISGKNILFRLKKEQIQALQGSADNLTIEEGNVLKVSGKEGRGHYLINPYVTVDIPQGSFSGGYKGEIESVLD